MKNNYMKNSILVVLLLCLGCADKPKGVIVHFPLTDSTRLDTIYLNCNSITIHRSFLPSDFNYGFYFKDTGRDCNVLTPVDLDSIVDSHCSCVGDCDYNVDVQEGDLDLDANNDSAAFDKMVKEILIIKHRPYFPNGVHLYFPRCLVTDTNLIIEQKENGQKP